MKSYQQAPSRKSKKRESAIKGKENKPSAISTGLFACERPRGRVGVRKRLIEAAVEDALVAFCGTRKRESGKPRNGRDATTVATSLREATFGRWISWPSVGGIVI